MSLSPTVFAFSDSMLAFALSPSALPMPASPLAFLPPTPTTVTSLSPPSSVSADPYPVLTPVPSSSSSSLSVPAPAASVPAGVPIAYSCSRCHRYKVSCDGERPCGRCVKSHAEADCQDRIRKGTRAWATVTADTQGTLAKVHRAASKRHKGTLATVEEPIPVPFLPHSLGVLAPPTTRSHKSEEKSHSSTAASVSSPSPSMPTSSAPVDRMTTLSHGILKRLMERYAEPRHPPLHVIPLVFFCHTFFQMSREDFGLLLLFFGYVPHRAGDHSFSLWTPPAKDLSELNSYSWPVLPDYFHINFENSPLTPLGDSDTSNFATLVFKRPLDPRTSPAGFDKIPQRDASDVAGDASFAMEHEEVVVVNREFERLFGWTQAEIRLMALQHGRRLLYKRVLDVETLVEREGGEMPYLPGFSEDASYCSHNVTVLRKYGDGLSCLKIAQLTKCCTQVSITFIPTTNN